MNDRWRRHGTIVESANLSLQAGSFRRKYFLVCHTTDHNMTSSRFRFTSRHGDHPRRCRRNNKDNIACVACGVWASQNGKCWIATGIKRICYACDVIVRLLFVPSMAWHCATSVANTIIEIIRIILNNDYKSFSIHFNWRKLTKRVIPLTANGKSIDLRIDWPKWPSRFGNYCVGGRESRRMWLMLLIFMTQKWVIEIARATILVVGHIYSI